MYFALLPMSCSDTFTFHLPSLSFFCSVDGPTVTPFLSSVFSTFLLYYPSMFVSHAERKPVVMSIAETVGKPDNPALLPTLVVADKFNSLGSIPIAPCPTPILTISITACTRVPRDTVRDSHAR